MTSGMMIALLAVFAALACAAKVAPRSTATREKLGRRVKTYACYYGPADTAGLSVFDMAIIEPRQFTKKEISDLSRTTIVIGYVSIGELGPERAKELEGKGRWYLDKENNGKPDRNPNWGSYYADPASDTWRTYVLAEIASVITDMGCQGIFMDTLDTIGKYPEATLPMARLIKEIRKSFPGIYLVANRGFELVPHLSDTIDAVMFESFTLRSAGENVHEVYDRNDLSWTNEIYAEKLAPFMKNGGLVLSLDYAESSETEIIDIAWSRSLDYGFLPYISRSDLQTISTIAGNDLPDIRAQYGRTAFLESEGNTK